MNQNVFSGQPNFDKSLNATLVQTFQDGTVVKTKCYFNKNANPMQATSLTPVDEHLLAGSEVDRYITLDNDPSQTQYRSYQVIGVTNSVEID